MKQKLIVFSGAGMSAESGIDTFRNSGGLWENNRIEDVATPSAWASNPERVQEFYNSRRKQILEAQPNNAHFSLKDLENHYDVQVITQNIDDLHERAGSSSVLHLHGNIRFSKSSGPNQETTYYPIEGWELKISDKCPEGYTLRPHVVWFGEAVPMYDEAIALMQNANILIVIGSSLQVYPAAGLVDFAPKESKKILIDPNGDSLNISKEFEIINEGATEGLQTFLDRT
jgi:NAD-dependent deacetylase